MKDEGRNIFSVFDEIIPRAQKEQLLRQKACVFWMTGLSGSGKTTIAKILEKKLHHMGFLTQILDGDNIRAGINNNLGFSENDRKENIRRIAEISKLFLNCGVITINCFISPTKEIRKAAKDIIGKADFREIFIDTPLEICEKRDTKGLYKRARSGEIKDFTGISSAFEVPSDPEIHLKTENSTPEESAENLLKQILPIIEYKVENANI